MKTAPPVLLVVLILLSHSGWTNGLCNLKNGTVAVCHELEDIKYIDTYDLESLKASVSKPVLSPGLFGNLDGLRHLDLSGGDLEQVEPASFHKLVELRSLDLSENRIEYLDLGAVDGLNHLRSLNLRKNNLRQLPPALARLKVLRHLDVQGNPLECNCATLRVRDLIAKRGVKISKKVLCAGPSSVKGTPLVKPDTLTVCAFEEQDREMQRDQGYEGSGEDLSSDEILDKFDEEEEEYEEVQDTSSVAPKEPEVETPFPESSEASTTSRVEQVTEEAIVSSAQTTDSTVGTPSIEETIGEDGEMFFDGNDKKERTTVAATTEKKETFKDALFYPVEGSGDEEEGSGEGSGTGAIFTDWGKQDEPTSEKDSDGSEESFLDMVFSVFWSSTEGPEETKEPNLEEEEFIDASAPKGANEETIVPKIAKFDQSEPSTTDKSTTRAAFGPTSGIELVNDGIKDTAKLGNVKVDNDGINDELAAVSPARQSKKGMGSYVVLAALLAILATLIGYAAYKGDFCRKKRKRGDVENGTELKDMQKSLLETGNSTQPKIASNGNVESAPLVENTHNHHEETRGRNDYDVAPTESPRSPNGTSEPVKPPRRAASPQDEPSLEDKLRDDANSTKDDSLSVRTGSPDHVANNGPMTRLLESNGPPLSPGAQRVKITLQENPDSVPRTPILITRTLAGENLVKTP